MSILNLLWNTIDNIMSINMTFLNYTFNFWDIFFASFYLGIIGTALGMIIHIKRGD